MATTQTTHKPVTDDDLFKLVDNFKKRGNWTEERHEVMKHLTGAQIDAEIMRLQAENPDRGSTPEEIQEYVAQLRKEWAAKRTAELVEA